MQDANTGARQDNLYAPPTARVADPDVVPSGRKAAFHVVSTTKVVVLTVATVGLYAVYWFWRHWEQHRVERKLDIWPVPRALFYIFYAHALNTEIDHRITRNDDRHDWSPGAWATLLVVAALINRLVDRLPETVVSLRAGGMVTLLSVLAMAAALANAQRAANIASGDRDALSNRRFTWANMIWLALGTVFWLLFSIGLMLPEEPTG